MGPGGAAHMAVPCGVQVSQANAPVIQAVLLDLPGLLFFSTYTLLVLFWAEIYHQARSLPTSKLRPIFVTANAVVYIVQVPPFSAVTDPNLRPWNACGRSVQHSAG